MVANSAPSRNVPASQRSLSCEVAGEQLVLHACGAMWWEAAGVLVFSDLHLEKASFYAERGQMLPPYDSAATLMRASMLVDRLQPTTVIALGDSFHDRRARMRMASEHIETVRSLTARADWVWIEGNHDPQPPADLGGRTSHELRLGPLTFRHEPAPGKSRGEIAGHLHPCARVLGRGRTVRARCFASDGERMVMPAYGALTGGLNVLDGAFRSIFPEGMIAAMLGRDGVYAAAGERLVADTVWSAG
jgi:DNA ligase-associated metallophosphoesterase